MHGICEFLSQLQSLLSEIHLSLSSNFEFTCWIDNTIQASYNAIFTLDKIYPLESDLSIFRTTVPCRKFTLHMLTNKSALNVLVKRFGKDRREKPGCRVALASALSGIPAGTKSLIRHIFEFCHLISFGFKVKTNCSQTEEISQAEH